LSTDPRPQFVIDTNWVLDLCVFHDPQAVALRQAIEHGLIHWLACPPMWAEWQRVLDYPQVQGHWQPRLASHGHPLDWCQQHATAVPSAPFCGWRCQDPDDQVFLDLAHQRRATLLSKDKAVLAWRRQAAGQGWHIHATAPENYLFDQIKNI